MDTSKVDSLTDQELRSALMSFGKDVGPVTSGTRNMMKSMLRKLLMPDSLYECTNSILPSQDVVKPLPVLQGSIPESDVYYGVFIPPTFDIDEDLKKVYIDKADCLAVLKRFQGSRFKTFSSHEEAVKFSEYGPIVVSTPNGSEEVLGNLISSPLASSEKPSPFRGPKYQDLLKFRKSIEQGNFDFFVECIENNPRYLVSSGDTPSILREGPRYNALHVACRSNKPEFCQKILNTVSEPGFFQRLYPDDSMESSERRTIFLLDLYLNMPDKGFNEIPLHFACKEGHIDCVKVLLSYPQCNKFSLNRYGQNPQEIICSRCENASEDLKDNIKLLFENLYYVPILRDTDNCLPPRIGSPFSPSLSTASSSRSSGNGLSCDSGSPISPSYKVKGCAGPMSPQKAESFYHRWRKNSIPSPLKSPQAKLAALRIDDMDKGVERIGRNLALELSVDWIEYWEFLNEFVNISSSEGLRKLDQYLKQKYDEIVEIKSQEKAEETLVFEAEKEVHSINVHIPPRGSDDAQEMNSTRSSLSSMSELCQNLEALRLNASLSPNPETNINTRISMVEQCDNKSDVESTPYSLKGSPSNNNNNNLEKYHSPHLNMSDDVLKSTSDQYNFAIQSTKISAQRISYILSDISHSIPLHIGPDFKIARKLTNKVKSEVLSLKKVLSRCWFIVREVNIDSLDFGFVHLFLAVKSSEFFIENSSSSDLYLCCETVKLVLDNLVSFEESSSDEEHSTSATSMKNLDNGNALSHLRCVMKHLFSCLEMSVQFSKSGKDGQGINFNELGECNCIWSDSTPEKTRCNSSCAVDVGNSAATTTSTVGSEGGIKGSGSRFSKAHSFLRHILFGSDNTIVHDSLDSSSIKSSTELLSQSESLSKKYSPSKETHSSSVVRHLSFEIDPENVSDAKTEGHDEDTASFVSALSSLEDENRMVTPEQIFEFFIKGKHPSKCDFDVFNALDGLDVDANLFPYVAHWLKIVENYSKEERKRW